MIYAVILAGGKGERFWPVSTPERPKQFSKLFSKKSLIVETKERLKGIIPFKNQIYVLPENLVPLLKKEVKKIQPRNIIEEPYGKNTAPAIAVAAWRLKEYRDSVMIVLPADHYIKKISRYKNDIKKAVKVARDGEWLVTFGIPPSYPATGYGYIETGEKIKEGVLKVLRFREKPDIKSAKKYIKKGNYFWNSGMFVWKVDTILKAFEKYMPSLFKHLQQVNFKDKKGIRKFYKNVESISIDYGVMEKADNIAMVKASFEWDDLGSWLAVERHGKKFDKNTYLGKLYSMDSEGCIAVSEEGVIAILGVKDLVVVSSGNKVLVAHKDRAEDVKKIARYIEKRR